jgi:hypothetical protein
MKASQISRSLPIALPTTRWTTRLPWASLPFAHPPSFVPSNSFAPHPLLRKKRKYRLWYKMPCACLVQNADQCLFFSLATQPVFLECAFKELCSEPLPGNKLSKHQWKPRFQPEKRCHILRYLCRRDFLHLWIQCGATHTNPLGWMCNNRSTASRSKLKRFWIRF